MTQLLRKKSFFRILSLISFLFPQENLTMSAGGKKWIDEEKSSTNNLIWQKFRSLSKLSEKKQMRTFIQISFRFWKMQNHAKCQTWRKMEPTYNKKKIALSLFKTYEHCLMAASIPNKRWVALASSCQKNETDYVQN